MIIKDTAHIYYKSPPNGHENVNSSMILHAENRVASQWELKQKNAEIAQLRQQLVEVAAQVWRSEQILLKLTKCLDIMDREANVSSQIKGIRLLIKQLRNSSVDKDLESNLAVDQQFIRKLQAKFSALSSNDLRICSLLRLNLSTKEVAQKLGICAESANKARYRIRKKLALSRRQNLVRFLIDF